MAANLHPKHRHELEVGSGISPEVIAARGAYTVSDPADLVALGYRGDQVRVPALVLPEHLLNGYKPTHHIKPDNPRPQKDEHGNVKRNPDGSIKYQKYDRPRGSANRLDVPPTVRDKVLDYNEPLVWTEGWKKADAAASHGQAVVALGGTWNFNIETEDGWMVPIEDFKHIPIKKRGERGRLNLIVFDSDAANKQGVRDARDRFRHLLLGYGGRVLYADLSPLPDGRKCGLDDYLLTHTIEDLWALAYDPEDAVAVKFQTELRRVNTLQSAMARTLAHRRAKTYLPVAVRFIGELQHQKEDGPPITDDGLYNPSKASIGGRKFDEYGRPTDEWDITESTVRNHLEVFRKYKDHIPGFRAEKREVNYPKRDVDADGVVTMIDDFHETWVYDYEGTTAEFLECLTTLPYPEDGRGKCQKCGHQKKTKTVEYCPNCEIVEVRAKPAQEGGEQPFTPNGSDDTADPPKPLGASVTPSVEDTPENWERLYSRAEEGEQTLPPSKNAEFGPSAAAQALRGLPMFAPPMEVCAGCPDPDFCRGRGECPFIEDLKPQAQSAEGTP